MLFLILHQTCSHFKIVPINLIHIMVIFIVTALCAEHCILVIFIRSVNTTLYFNISVNNLR